MATKLKMSKTMVMHYVKLIVRSVFFLAVLILYILVRLGTVENVVDQKQMPVILTVIGIVYAVEMALRFFPSHLESPGCQKQFKGNFIKCSDDEPILQSGWRTLAVIAAWVALNGVIGILYFTKVIDAGILVLISLLYGVCDMICILFFCPFQTWFMRNRCCTTCRIYNWDFAMMFTPLIFIPSVFTYSLVIMSLLLLIRWEITLRRHPERFAPNTNGSIDCAHCTEKLCKHKRQILGLIQEANARIKSIAKSRKEKR